jgi:hypothetical protein
MADTGSNPFAAGRASLREIAKWMMAGMFSVVALIVGSSTITQLGAQDWQTVQFWVAALTLVAAAGLCWIPFGRAVRVMHPEVWSLKDFAEAKGGELKKAFDNVSKHLGPTLPNGKNLSDFYAGYDQAKAEARKGTDRVKLENLKVEFNTCREACISQLVLDRFNNLVINLYCWGSVIAVLFVISVYAANPPKKTLTLAENPELKPLTTELDKSLEALGVPLTCRGPNKARLLTISQPDSEQQTTILIPPTDEKATSNCLPRKVFFFADGTIKVK